MKRSRKWLKRAVKLLVIGSICCLGLAILVLGIMLINDLNWASIIIFICMVIFFIFLWRETA